MNKMPNLQIDASQEKCYACIERFRIYLYDHQFRVLNDKKPLFMILQKPLTSTTPRLQSMILKQHEYQIHRVQMGKKWL